MKKASGPEIVVEVIQHGSSITPALPAAVENASQVSNGLGSALGFGTPFDVNGYPQNQGAWWTEQVSNSTSMFKNLRWYLVSNLRQLLNEVYVEIGLVQTICDVPVDDALRGGVKIKTKNLSEEQIEELQVSMDRDDDLGKAGQAAKWNRLFGGAGILILTDQDPEDPFDLESIGPDEPLEFRAVDMWELFWDKQNTEGYDPSTQTEDFEWYSYYGVKVHKSRVMKLKGLEAPSFIRPRLRGWGFSVVEALVRSLNQYFKGTDVIYECLDEFKVDVFKIKNLVNTLLSPAGEEKIRRRVQLAAWQKNYQNALTMDAEDDWDHRQLSFTGIGETMANIRMQVASDMRMPLTKLFGISAAGFNSGEDDLEVYNAMVESQVRNKLKYQILRMLEIKCQKLFGFIPPDLSIEFEPLRMLSAEQEEIVKTQKHNRLVQSLQMGGIDLRFYHDACNRGGLFDVQIDTGSDNLNPDGPNQPEEAGANKDPYDDKDTDDPGSDREDSQKSRATELGGIAKGGGKPKSAAKRSPASPEAPDPVKEMKPAVQKEKAKTHTNEGGGLIVLGPSARVITSQIKRYSLRERLGRIFANSAAYDKAAYEAEGGDKWIDPRRKPLFENPGNVDESLWEKGKEASMAALGEVRWQFVTWWYKKHGGRF